LAQVWLYHVAQRRRRDGRIQDDFCPAIPIREGDFSCSKRFAFVVNSCNVALLPGLRTKVKSARKASEGRVKQVRIFVPNPHSPFFYGFLYLFTDGRSNIPNL
jgi:hypothetical protein